MDSVEISIDRKPTTIGAAPVGLMLADTGEILCKGEADDGSCVALIVDSGEEYRGELSRLCFPVELGEIRGPHGEAHGAAYREAHCEARLILDGTTAALNETRAIVHEPPGIHAGEIDRRVLLNQAEIMRAIAALIDPEQTEERDALACILNDCETLERARFEAACALGLYGETIRKENASAERGASEGGET